MYKMHMLWYLMSYEQVLTIFVFIHFISYMNSNMSVLIHKNHFTRIRLDWIRQWLKLLSY